MFYVCKNYELWILVIKIYKDDDVEMCSKKVVPVNVDKKVISLDDKKEKNSISNPDHKQINLDEDKRKKSKIDIRNTPNNNSLIVNRKRNSLPINPITLGT